jgi:hypothetical protein
MQGLENMERVPKADIEPVVELAPVAVD